MSAGHCVTPSRDDLIVVALGDITKQAPVVGGDFCLKVGKPFPRIERALGASDDAFSKKMSAAKPGAVSLLAALASDSALDTNRSSC
jgi:hypothetical protein